MQEKDLDRGLFVEKRILGKILAVMDASLPRSPGLKSGVIGLGPNQFPGVIAQPSAHLPF